MLLCGLGLSSTAGTAQTAAPASLPAALREHVKQEQFQVVTSIRGLPLGVREALQTLFGGFSLDITESGSELQRKGAAVDPKLPLRRLAAAGCSGDHCLVYYERGGNAPAWLVALFHWTPEGTRFEWGGQARSGLVSVDDVRKAVLSGAVRGPVTNW